MPPLAVGGFAARAPRPPPNRVLAGACTRRGSKRRKRAGCARSGGDGAHHVASSAFTCASRFDASAVSKTTHVTLFKPRTSRCPRPSRDLKCALGSSQRLALARYVCLASSVCMRARHAAIGGSFSSRSPAVAPPRDWGTAINAVTPRASASRMES